MFPSPSRSTPSASGSPGSARQKAHRRARSSAGCDSSVPGTARMEACRWSAASGCARTRSPAGGGGGRDPRSCARPALSAYDVRSFNRPERPRRQPSDACGVARRPLELRHHAAASRCALATQSAWVRRADHDSAVCDDDCRGVRFPRCSGSAVEVLHRECTPPELASGQAGGPRGTRETVAEHEGTKLSRTRVRRRCLLPTSTPSETRMHLLGELREASLTTSFSDLEVGDTEADEEASLHRSAEHRPPRDRFGSVWRARRAAWSRPTTRTGAAGREEGSWHGPAFFQARFTIASRSA